MSAVPSGAAASVASTAAATGSVVPALPQPAAVPAPSATSLDLASVPVATVSSRKLTAYVTGYTYYDNTPAGSSIISHPVLHKRAGGRGTYADPITVAVGHRYVKGRDVLDFPKGTRFYLYYLDRYFIVEDSCGDGPHPEREPCHVHPKGTSAWLDIWIDGKGSGSRSATRCAERITGNHEVLLNPPRNLTAVSASVSRGGRCAV